MKLWKKLLSYIRVGTWLWLGGAGFVATSQGGELSLDSVGVRGGQGANRSSHDFRGIEGFADWKLPWKFDLGRDWRLNTKLDLSMGWLGDGNDAFIGKLGPVLQLRRDAIPVVLEFGISPTILSRAEFETKDLGIPFQFSTYLGLTLELGRNAGLDFRFQHMSNAGLACPNDGMNMVLVGLSYRF